MTTLVTGAFGCIGSWVVRRLLAEGEPLVLYDLGGDPIPFPDALDDSRFQAELGPAPATPFDDGVRETMEEFARLREAGRLDRRELA